MNIEELARQIAFRMDPDSLMDAEDVGAFLKCTPRYVLERFTNAPGFPKAIRLTGPDGSRAQPRWKRHDITNWVNSQAAGQSKRGGRPRNTQEL
jgi:hypothetical protein